MLATIQKTSRQPDLQVAIITMAAMPWMRTRPKPADILFVVMVVSGNHNVKRKGSRRGTPTPKIEENRQVTKREQRFLYGAVMMAVKYSEEHRSTGCQVV